jgi:hypothetical protein
MKLLQPYIHLSTPTYMAPSMTPLTLLSRETMTVIVPDYTGSLYLFLRRLTSETILALLQ